MKCCYDDHVIGVGSEQAGNGTDTYGVEDQSLDVSRSGATAARYTISTQERRRCIIGKGTAISKLGPAYEVWGRGDINDGQIGHTTRTRNQNALLQFLHLSLVTVNPMPNARYVPAKSFCFSLCTEPRGILTPWFMFRFS